MNYSSAADFRQLQLEAAIMVFAFSRSSSVIELQGLLAIRNALRQIDAERIRFAADDTGYWRISDGNVLTFRETLMKEADDKLTCAKMVQLIEALEDCRAVIVVTEGVLSPQRVLTFKSERECNSFWMNVKYVDDAWTDLKRRQETLKGLIRFYDDQSYQHQAV